MKAWAAVYMNSVSHENKRIIKSTLIVLAVILIIILIVAIWALITIDNDQKEKFEETEAIIKPAYSEIQKKYDNNVELTDCGTRGLYYYDFRSNKQTSNNNCFELSVDIFNIVDSYIKSNHSLNDAEYCISTYCISNDHDISFTTHKQHSEVEVRINAKIDVKFFRDLSKIRSLAYLSVDQSQYSAADLNKIREWCRNENVKLIT